MNIAEDLRAAAEWVAKEAEGGAWSGLLAQQSSYAVRQRPGHDNLAALQTLSAAAERRLDDALLLLRAALERSAPQRTHDSKLAELDVAARHIRCADPRSLAREMQLECGPLMPPGEIEQLATWEALMSPFDCLHRVATLMGKAADHLQREAGNAQA